MKQAVNEVIEAYSQLQTLTEARAFLCTDVSSNIVVLKRLNDDCLHRNQLHPSIRERLAKVRELPHARLATLRGVERWQGAAFLVWTWLDGETWDERVSKPLARFGSLSSALVEAVDALHEMGIVHGNLHERNVIVRADDQVWLSDVSPYLYTDPAADITAVVRLLDGAVPRLPAKPAERLARLLDETATGGCGLRELSQALRQLEEEDDVDVADQVQSGNHYRIRSIMMSVLVLLAGAGFWLGIRWDLARSLPPMPTTFPSLKAESR